MFDGPRAEIDFIFLSLIRWDAEISSPALCLAQQIARHGRVFYIDHPFTVKDVLTGLGSDRIRSRWTALTRGSRAYRKLEGFGGRFTAVTPRMVLPINWLPPGRIHASLSQANECIVAGTLRRLIRDFEVKRYIFINSFDPFYLRQLPRDLPRPLLHVYQTIDDIAHSAYVRRHGPNLENQAIAEADLTLATSRELVRLKSPLSSDVHYLPNAADADLFSLAARSDLPCPVELRGIKGPVIGYTGAIDPRLDSQLLSKVAEAHPDSTLLMIGPIDNGFADDGLADRSNVVFTGPKPIAELPAYLRRIDCAIIPFKCNALTRSIYPLKINEYLSAGRPVVSTAFSEDIAEFADVAIVARDHDAFLAGIDRALREDSREHLDRRLLAGAGNSWSARVAQLWQILEAHLRRSEPGREANRS